MGSFNFNYKDKSYEVDSKSFLVDFQQWDENFAEGMAAQLGISPGLTKEHWEVIRFIRKAFLETGRCPLVYETCRTCGFRLSELRKLFPTGYFRGAWKLAGISSIKGHLGLPYHPASSRETMAYMESYDKTYEIDARGFLVNPDQWDDQYAVHKAYEMKVHGGVLSDEHWKIIQFLRETYRKKKKVPTVYETCEANQIDLDELERLFPDGYHRGAVKIAGLRS